MNCKRIKITISNLLENISDSNSAIAYNTISDYSTDKFITQSYKNRYR